MEIEENAERQVADNNGNAPPRRSAPRTATDIIATDALPEPTGFHGRARWLRAAAISRPAEAQACCSHQGDERTLECA